jgi:hypothetical protein
MKFAMAWEIGETTCLTTTGGASGGGGIVQS